MKFSTHLRSALLALAFMFITGTIRADNPPLATTLTATSVSTNNATLNGTATGGWTNAVVWFQYGLSTNYGQTTAPMIVSATNATTVFSQTIVTGVVVGTNYHFRVVATNSGGIAYGRDLAFNHLFVQSSTVLPNVSTRYTDAFSNPSAGVCDYDNDGDFDILLSGKRSSLSVNNDYYAELLRNDGNGTFTPVNSGLAQVGGSITSGDFDNDNLVDALVLDGQTCCIYSNE